MVKVFNSIFATSLNDRGRGKREKNRIVLAVSVEITTAKEIVFDLVDELGFDPFDLGGFARYWRQIVLLSVLGSSENIIGMKRRWQQIFRPGGKTFRNKNGFIAKGH
ncbi:hypothetical protein [Pedobacter sp. NJ-S-72]